MSFGQLSYQGLLVRVSPPGAKHIQFDVQATKGWAADFPDTSPGRWEAIFLKVVLIPLVAFLSEWLANSKGFKVSSSSRPIKLNVDPIFINPSLLVGGVPHQKWSDSPPNPH